MPTALTRVAVETAISYDIATAQVYKASSDVSLSLFEYPSIHMAPYTELPRAGDVILPGVQGVHTYEVIVCDKWGVALGQINTAVVQQIDWQLDDIGGASFDFAIFDPSATVLSPFDLPGVVEIQIWRDNQLIWWGLPITATYDAEKVHVQCSGFLWWFSQLAIGPNVNEMLQNGNFDWLDNPLIQDPGGLGPTFGSWIIWKCNATIWDGFGVLASETAAALGQPNSQISLRLQGTANGDCFVVNRVHFSTAAILGGGLSYDLSGWVYVPWDGVPAGQSFSDAFPANTSQEWLALQARGLYIEAHMAFWFPDPSDPSQPGELLDVVLPGAVSFATIDHKTPLNTWVRLDAPVQIPAAYNWDPFDPTVSIVVGDSGSGVPGPTGPILPGDAGCTPSGSYTYFEVRCYATAEPCWWGNIQLFQDVTIGTPTWEANGPGNDVAEIMRSIVEYAQDPTWGKNDKAIALVPNVETGYHLVRAYDLSDNTAVLDALQEFPQAGICDFEVYYDPTGHFRTFGIGGANGPTIGSYKANLVLDVSTGQITDMQGTCDGSKVASLQRFLGQGSSGVSQDMGYKAWTGFLGRQVAIGSVPSYQIGGKTATAVGLVEGYTSIEVATPNFFTVDDCPFTDAGGTFHQGKGVSSYNTQVVQPGTVILELADDGGASYPTASTIAVISKPLNATPPGGWDLIAVGGDIIESVNSAIPGQPLATLQPTAEATLRVTDSAQILPTVKTRADGPQGMFGSVWPGDVIRAALGYGWVPNVPTNNPNTNNPDGSWLRVVAMSLYPPTEELGLTLNEQAGAGAVPSS